MIRALRRNGAGLVFSAIVLALPASAVPIASHVGQNDPTTEGWTRLDGSAGQVVVGPLDDGGISAWSVDDQGTAQGTTLLYLQSVSDADIALGNAGGWVLRVVLRVPSSDVTDDGSPFAAYRDGMASWQMNWGHDGAGNTVVKLFTDTSGALLGPTVTVPGTSTYHTYELVYDPVAASADLFIDGVERVSDHLGLPGNQVGNAKQVLFGAGRSAVAGEGRYAEVTLSVPEPGALALLVLLMPWLVTRRQS